jgi:hypothetical protein
MTTQPAAAAQGPQGPQPPPDLQQEEHESNQIKPQKSRKKFQIITPTSSSVSATSASASPSEISSQYLPNIDPLPYTIKASIYELKELAIRIISLLKIQINLNFYERQKLSQLMTSFQETLCLKLEGYLKDKATISCQHCLLFLHYILGLILSFQDLVSSSDLLIGSEKKIDQLCRKIIKRCLIAQDPVSLTSSPSSVSASSSSAASLDSILALQNVLKLFPEDFFPKTNSLLSGNGQEKQEQEDEEHAQDRSHRLTQSSSSTNEETGPGRSLSSRLSRSLSILSSLFGRSSSKIHASTVEESETAND